MAEAQTGTYKVALGDSDAAGGVLAVQNPEGVDLIITRLIVDLTDAADSSGTADFGVAATVATNDALIDGLDVNAAAGVFDNIENQGSNGKSAVLWPAGYYLTGSKATGAMAGLTGYAHIQYVRRSG